MTWRYVIMANGVGQRWNNHLGIPKHLYEVEGETLVARIVRQLRNFDPRGEVIISSSDPRVEVSHTLRHEPEKNEIELDRFVPELITENTCFLYGDTFYTDHALQQIIADKPEGIRFFATEKSIVAVKSADSSALFRHLDNVRTKFLSGQLPTCKGWQLLDSYREDVNETAADSVLVAVEDRTMDFNTPEDAAAFESAGQD